MSEKKNRDSECAAISDAAGSTGIMVPTTANEIESTSTSCKELTGSGVLGNVGCNASDDAKHSWQMLKKHLSGTGIRFTPFQLREHDEENICNFFSGLTCAWLYLKIAMSL